MSSDHPPETPTKCVILLVELDQGHLASFRRPAHDEYEAAWQYCRERGWRLSPPTVAVLRVATDGTLTDVVGLPARDTDSPSGSSVFVLGPCPDPLPMGIYEFLRTEIEAGATVHSMEWGELSCNDLDVWLRRGLTLSRRRLGRLLRHRGLICRRSQDGPKLREAADISRSRLADQVAPGPAAADHEVGDQVLTPYCRPVPPLSVAAASSEMDSDWMTSPRAYCEASPKRPSLGPPMTSPSWGGGRSGDAPVRPPTREPLPHDGLFIRRNNAYGTKSIIGIGDLLQEGILIDQERIRFDDFVVSDANSLPLPEPGKALAVSTGLTETPPGCATHPAATHFLEVAIRAGTTNPDIGATGASIPVNFVFAVDVSGSMRGEKLDSAKAAIAELYQQLRDDDIIGVIAFDTQARVALRATRKGDLSPDELARVLGGLRASGGTDLNLGIHFGIDEISRFSGTAAETVDCVYLFSDGDPTSGEVNWIAIRKNVAERVRSGLTLSCFGFGTDARMRELQALAGLSGGHSAFVTTPADVKDVLLEDIGRRDHLAALNIQLRFDIAPDVEIWHLYGHDLITDPTSRAAIEQEVAAVRHRAQEVVGVESLPDLITQEKGIRIFAPDLALGETYWIVFELSVPSARNEDDLGTVAAQYVDVLARSATQQEMPLNVAGAIAPETVLAHAVGLRTSEVTFYALDDLHDKDRSMATRRITEHLTMLQNAYATAPIPQFRDDQVVLRNFMSLVSNLGQPISWQDSYDDGMVRGITNFAMNSFGHVRSGHLRRELA